MLKLRACILLYDIAVWSINLQTYDSLCFASELLKTDMCTIVLFPSTEIAAYAMLRQENDGSYIPVCLPAQVLQEFLGVQLLLSDQQAQPPLVGLFVQPDLVDL